MLESYAKLPFDHDPIKTHSVDVILTKLKTNYKSCDNARNFQYKPLYITDIIIKEKYSAWKY